MTHKENRGPESPGIVKARRIDRALHIDLSPTSGEAAAKWRIDESTGFLHVTARLARTGVQTYGDADGNTWGEYRDESEVFSPEAMESFRAVVVTDDHPPEFVNKDNVGKYQRGHLDGDVWREGDWLMGRLVVTDAGLIAKMFAGKAQISGGYEATMVPHEGRTDSGQSYKYKQTQIRGNHKAVVDRARAGAQCRALLDSLDALAIEAEPTETPTMSTKTIKIGDAQHELPTAVADAIEAERKAAAEAHAKEVADASAPQAPPEDVSALKARIDMLEADKAERESKEDARIDERAELVSIAKAVCPDVPTRGVKSDELRRAVVVKLRPDMEAKLDAHKGEAGYLRACFDHAVEAKRSDAETHSALDAALRGQHVAAPKSGMSESVKALDDAAALRSQRSGRKEAN